MAAWVGFVLFIAGIQAGGFFVWWRLKGAVNPSPSPPAVLSPELMETLFVRLLDASIPIAQALQDDESKVPRHEAEYEPPDDEVLDWTDPFIGMERPLVARLAPGEGIPGVTADPQRESIYDQWLREDEAEVAAASWVEPVQLDDETRVE